MFWIRKHSIKFKHSECPEGWVREWMRWRSKGEQIVISLSVRCDDLVTPDMRQWWAGDEGHELAAGAWSHPERLSIWEKLQEEAFIHSRKKRKTEMRTYLAYKTFSKNTRGRLCGVNRLAECRCTIQIQILLTKTKRNTHQSWALSIWWC